jgi:murein DD-endopeptidase MepM/ murein hydrolase activator NlpD
MRLLRLLVTAALLIVAAQAGTSGYTVKKGDTLGRISAQLHVPVKVLAEANGIKNPDYIRYGSVLRLPGSAPSMKLAAATVQTGARFYVVAVGDNLATIARRFGTTVSDLVKRNHITHPDIVRAGTRLELPGGTWYCPVRGHYTVVSNFGAPRPGNVRHEGNDIFADRGSPVVAPVSGTLRQVKGRIAGNAFYLAGDDGSTYYFAHLDRYLHGPGRVDAGAVIGKVGNTGDAEATPPHLHFEIHPGNGKPGDPFPTLHKWC